MFEFLWNNGLVRAILAAFIIVETLSQEVVFGIPPNDTHWTIAVAVGAWYFGTGSVKPVVGAVTRALSPKPETDEQRQDVVASALKDAE